MVFTGSRIVEASKPVENDPLYNHGILYEKMNNVKIQFGEWMFHSSLKLDIFVKETRVIEIFATYINESCTKLDPDFGIDCVQILNEINYEVNNFNGIKDIIGAQCNTSSRSKRQINFIGHIFKEITGIMDNEDSTRLDNDLTKIHNNEQQLMEQLHKQNIVIDSIFEIANQTIFNVQGKLLNFSHAIDSLNQQKNKEKSKNIARNHLTDLLGEINLILSHVIRRKDLILTLMRTGEMDLTPELINPTAFLNELYKAKKVLTNGIVFPFELNFNNIMKFYKFGKVITKLNGCALKMNIIVPTYSNIIFEAYKGTSVPTFKNDKFFIVTFENDVILKSINNSIITTMKFGEYEKCTSLQDLKLCPFLHVFEQVSTSRDCNVQMFVNRTSNSCTYQPLNLKHQLWIQMANKNSWIYAIPNSTTINVLYNNTLSTLELYGVGMLKLIRPCLIKSNDIYLHYFASGSSDFEFEKIKIDFPEAPKETKILDDKIPDTMRNNAISEFNEKTLFNEINELKAMNAGKIQLMNIELEKHSFSLWKTMIIIFLVIVTGLILYKLYIVLKLKFKKYSSVSSRPMAPTAPEDLSDPLTRLSEPFQVVLTTNERDNYLDNARELVSFKRSSRPSRQVLGEVSF